MGIKTSVAALLVRAREQGASFARTATIGRQSLTVPAADLATFARRLGAPEPDWRTFCADGYCEDFLRQVLGAREVVSFDASAYESASVVHDLNQPLPDAWAGQFDAVIDGGTIEHIFDVKQVLTNYMRLAKVGGGVFICTNANNLCGHGFYQFSPEFFYRVFSEENGFRVEMLCLIETPFHFVEMSPRQKVYVAADPAELGKRTVIVGDKPLSIYVHAVKQADRPLFAEPPYQSDYRVEWTTHASAQAAPAEAAVSDATGRGDRTFDFQYMSWRESLRRRRQQRRKNSLRNRKWFTPLVP